MSHDDRQLRAGRATGAGAETLARTILQVLATAACYYAATRTAWMLCFPDSKVSLFFPPHAVLVSILLLVPTRHWWAYTLAAASSHFFATQQEHWPALYALTCEAFDAVKYLLTAAGIRLLIRSPLHLVSLREAILFVAVAVIGIPAATSLWGAAFTVSNGFGTSYWIEWRNLTISNAVTTIVLVPVILASTHRLVTRDFAAAPARVLESALLAAGLGAVAWLAFGRSPAGPETSPALLYAPIPLLIWAALRFGLGGVSASMLLMTTMAIWGTMQGRGPFLAQTPSENALALQLFILVAAAPLMLLSVAIADERRSNQALRVSEERMSLAAESAQLALWDWDAAGDRVWMTHDGRQRFGIARDQALDFATVSDRVHPDDRQARAMLIRQALESRGSYELEYRVVMRDGSVRWLAGRGRYCLGDDGTPRMLGVAMDITRRKEADAEARMQRDSLAHLARAASLSALSGSIAHELSQPLASILNNAEAGQRFMAQDPPDLGEVRAILVDIAGEDRRARGIIDRLRNMLRGGEVTLQAVPVRDCVDELLALVQSDLIERGVSLSNEVDARLPPARTDRLQLQQVLLNLVLNACDAMKANPPSERILTLSARVDPRELVIGVLDRGVGLPHDIESVFAPFYTTKEDGLGMGLSICRTLVTAHGGRVWAERRGERGAAFYVALPLSA